MLFCTQGLILPTIHEHLSCFTSLASHIMDSFVARKDFMMPYYQAKIDFKLVFKSQKSSLISSLISFRCKIDFKLELFCIEHSN